MSAIRASSPYYARLRPAGAARSSSLTLCARWRWPIGTTAGTAAECTACSSGAAGTIPGTSKTSCGPRSSSRAHGRTWPQISFRGSETTWRRYRASVAGQAPPKQAGDMTSMQSVDSYRDEIIAALVPLAPEEISLSEADGTVLSADVSAAWPMPGFDNSAMDGYAVIAADVAAASAEHPVTLPVDGEVAAGDTTSRTLTRGRVIRIMTGALLPADANAVVPVEWTDDGSERVSISQCAAQGH